MILSKLVLLFLFASSLALQHKRPISKHKTRSVSTLSDTSKTKYLVIYEGSKLNVQKVRGFGVTQRVAEDISSSNVHWVEVSKQEAEAMLITNPKAKIYPNEFPHQPHVYSLVPPYDDPMYKTSWYFNGGQGLPSLGVEELWTRGVSGKGVTIIVIDDSVSFYHPELTNKKNIPFSYNYKNESKETDPDTPNQWHGTSIAGIIASTPGNSQCGVGIASGSDIAARVAIYEGVKPSVIIRAMSEDVTEIGVINNSWGMDACDGGKIANGRCHLLPNVGVEQMARSAAISGRRGLGSIVVFATGDQGINPNADTNLSPLTRTPYAITVGAVLRSGVRAPYSVPGKSLFIVGPSGAENGQDGLVAPRTRFDQASRELIHDCVTDFTGTSAAAAVVSSIVAMVVENNPRLSYQDIRQIFIRSSRRIQPNDPSWVTNAAGISYSRLYGFGYVDASAAVALSSLWPETKSYTTQQGITPDNWAHSGTATSYTRFMNQGNIVIPPKTKVVVPFFIKQLDALIVENIVVTIPNSVDSTITVSIGKMVSGTIDTKFSEVVSVQETGTASPNSVLDLITNGDGVVDTSIDILTYEYAGMMSSGTWEVMIENNGSSNITFPLLGMKFTPSGLPSIMEIRGVDVVYHEDGLIRKIVAKPSINSVVAVTYKYGRGMYAYIKIGERDPVMVVDDDGRAIAYNPTDVDIEIKWRSAYGCPSLKGCKAYNDKMMIILVNAEGTFEALSFTTSQNISSSWYNVTITVAQGDEGLIEGEEEVLEEETTTPPVGGEEEEETTVTPPQEEEETIPPVSEEESEEGGIIGGEEESSEEIQECEEEELVPWPDEEEEMSEEESDIPPPIYPPEEEEIVDGFDLSPAKITKLVTALTALLVALAL